MKYLAAIDPAKWVLYAMVDAGAATFGWRSNNIGEIGQGSVLKNLRAMHPIQFFSELQALAVSKLTSLAKDHKTWRVQSAHQPVAGLIPHGVKLYNMHTQAAAYCTVKALGALAQVSYRNPTTHEAHEPRLVDPVQKTCTCLMFQDLKFPCKCAIAFAMSKGTASNLYAADHGTTLFRFIKVDLVISSGINNYHIVL
eukprot:m.395363 g.395363  ORF g.395363 m.395363 type:complete len:197 (+) comp16770_c2_seq11:17457-18047(+)